MPETDAPTPTAESIADQTLLTEAVQEAGAIAKRFYDTGFDHWLKSKNDPVTEADLAVDKALNRLLTKDRPDYGWLSEESNDDLVRLNKDRVWIVDPIDGTRAFVEKRPEFTICAALVEHGRPLCAAVFNPVTDEMYTATLHAGATLNGATIRTTARTTLDDAAVLGTRKTFEHPRWPDPWPTMRFSMRNSVALRMALVAAGAYDACISFGPKSDWDLVAADLIVTEAGGAVTDHTGSHLLYNRTRPRQPSLVAAGRDLHQTLIGRTKVFDELK